ncbi:helix-turn-helix domain-containing protein [Halotalea alkalilenta]|uniref:XRE family transcriptional regulator n=1 Tax=Halotalea alkalilenta TaxID=376489 RepID=A0A172YB03_9GAMM|nr:XRE family transcriptional regulator [Halotalea alkalilenta]ANF56441.1 XRE family transcriptional regulator [Halotalea alkalilenta]
MSITDTGSAHFADLDGDELGARVRHARLAHKLTLKAVAEKAHCSESQVSKVERGLVMPSLAMLHRLAMAVNTNVSDLIGTASASGPILRQGERLVSEFDPSNGVRLERLDGASRGSLLQAHIHIIPPGAKSDGQINHIGEEVGYVLEGTILLTLGDQAHVLNRGDAFHFSSHEPHGYENIGEGTARIHWVNTPATF